MVSVFRYHEISEAHARILNPLSEDNLLRLGRIVGPRPGARHLDLACGKGEMLCRLAAEYGITGLGIDIWSPVIDIARQRAIDLGVEGAVEFRVGDAGAFRPDASAWDVISCIGATWIGGGLTGTLDLMRPGLTLDGWALVGEAFWSEEAPGHVRAEQEAIQAFSDLSGTLERIEAAGFELVDMVLASTEDWDRYEAGQWHSVRDWLGAHPEDPDAPEIAERTAQARRAYLAHLRRCMGWGVFALKLANSGTGS